MSHDESLCVCVCVCVCVCGGGGGVSDGQQVLLNAAGTGADTHVGTPAETYAGINAGTVAEVIDGSAAGTTDGTVMLLGVLIIIVVLKGLPSGRNYCWEC